LKISISECFIIDIAVSFQQISYYYIY